MNSHPSNTILMSVSSIYSISLKPLIRFRRLNGHLVVLFCSTNENAGGMYDHG